MYGTFESELVKQITSRDSQVIEPSESSEKKIDNDMPLMINGGGANACENQQCHTNKMASYV